MFYFSAGLVYACVISALKIKATTKQTDKQTPKPNNPVQYLMMKIEDEELFKGIRMHRCPF